MSKLKEKFKALDQVIAAIDKQFGKGNIMRLSSEDVERIPVYPTGSLSLDLALGVGGIPIGRIVEIFGQESSGKTTLALEIIASAQRQGAVAAFIDAEHALDAAYARKLGVNPEFLLVSQPDSGEQALEIVENLARSGGVDLIVIDSVAALVPRAEIDGEMGDVHMGLQARLMSQALRKLTPVANKNTATIIFINQIRMKIGVTFGNPETTTGGNALKFYASVRLEVRRSSGIKNGNETNGFKTKVKVVKNKVAPPFGEAEFDLLFGEGIDKTGEIVDVAERLNIIERSGTWYSYNGKSLGQGRDQARQSLLEKNQILAEILENINSRKSLNDPKEKAEAA
ncbi:MAG: recombinase RecA [Deltaproteobacteria bacterium]|nr:recombinase RecA [Deltaproteobacteria bacterium]